MAAAAVLASSCSMITLPFNDDDLTVGMESVLLVGTVTDPEGNPIEHIKMNFEWNNGSYQDIKYTSSIGRYETNIKDNRNGDMITLDITIEDIDGEKNGGLFESRKESLTFIKDEITDPVVTLDYRLNRATVSESSRQF